MAVSDLRMMGRAFSGTWQKAAFAGTVAGLVIGGLVGALFAIGAGHVGNLAEWVGAVAPLVGSG